MSCAATQFLPISPFESPLDLKATALSTIAVDGSASTSGNFRQCSNKGGHGTRCKRPAVEGRLRCAKCMACARKTRVIHWRITMVNQSKFADRKKDFTWRPEEYITADWLKFLYETQPDCYWCGASYLCTKNRRHNRGRTIERLDNSLPHLKRNCVFACAWCNRRSWQPSWKIEPFHLHKYKYCVSPKLSRKTKLLHDRLVLELKAYWMRK